MSAEDPRLAALDELDLDALDDFESDDLDADAASSEDEELERGRNSYVGDLWRRHGFNEEASREERVLAAHKLVQSFVNAFATDGNYRVTFDPAVGVAGTDLEGYRVIVTPGPLFDESLTLEEAAVVLTGIATHEISHPRYGRQTAAATRRVFGSKRAPNTLSNVLDDVRIERRFAADYPGYADVFDPVKRYVARTTKAARGDSFGPSMDNVVGLAILAIRYPDRAIEWPTPELQAERDWWRAWSERWSREDSPRRHVEGVREALRRIVRVQAIRRKKLEAALAAQAALRARDPEPTDEASEPAATSGQERLLEALKHMPPEARTIVRLSATGVRGPEIAATLNVSPELVRKTLRAARRVARQGAVITPEIEAKAFSMADAFSKMGFKHAARIAADLAREDEERYGR